MAPVGARLVGPPVVWVAQVDWARGLAEHDRRGREHRGVCAGIVVRIGWPLSERDVAGHLDEALELGVGDGMGIHPETLDRDLVRRCFFRIVAVRSHEEGTIRNPDHAGARESVHRSDDGAPCGHCPSDQRAARVALWGAMGPRRGASRSTGTAGPGGGFRMMSLIFRNEHGEGGCVRRQRGPVVGRVCPTGRRRVRDRAMRSLPFFP